MHPGEDLTDREREVLELMARGLTNGQIAERLGIGFETVKTHVSRVIAKTGAVTREEAVANYRASTRPLSRLSRRFRAWLAISAVKIAAGTVVAVAIAIAGLAAWQFAGNNADGANSGPLVLFYSSQGGDYSKVEELPFREALRRQEELVGVIAPIPAALPGDNLRPLFVTVQLPPESIPLGLAEFTVSYGDGSTERESGTLLVVDWTCWYANDDNIDVDGHAFDSPIESNEWDDVLELSHGVEVGYFATNDTNAPDTYVVWHADATLMARVTTKGISREDAIHVLESILGK